MAMTKRERLVYVKALIEIKLDRLLQYMLAIEPVVSHVAFVKVDYSWKPPICSTCHFFGHLAESCSHALSSPPSKPIENFDFKILIPTKVLFPRPPNPLWVPKSAPPVEPDPVFPVSHVLSVHDDVSFGQSSDEGPVYWNSNEKVWVHDDSDTRYSPTLEHFYKYVMDVDGDGHQLYYCLFEESLVLASAGQLMEANKKVLVDVNWDRGYIITRDYVGLVYDIVAFSRTSSTLLGMIRLSVFS